MGIGLGLVSVFVLLFCTNGYVIAQILLNHNFEILTKNWTISYDSGITFQPGKLITEDENTFLYATCQHLKQENSELCNITLDTSIFSQADSKKNCFNIKMRPVKYHYGYKEFILRRLTNKKMLIVLTRLIDGSKNYETDFSILDMSDCFIINDLTYSTQYDEKHFFFIQSIIYENSFQIVSNIKKKCKDKVNCVSTYDFDGNEVSELKSFNSNLNYFTMPVMEQSPNKGYYIFSAYKFNEKVIWNVTFENSSNQFKKLMSESINFWPRRVAHSNSYGLYSLCWLRFVPSKQLQCRQFDNQSVRLNLTFELPNIAHFVAVRNLADGGILIATGSCKNNSEWVLTDYNCSTIRVQRIAADGEQYRALEIPNGFQSENVNLFDRFEVQIIEKSEDEVCFLWTWHEMHYASKVKKLIYSKWCIPQKLTLIEY